MKTLTVAAVFFFLFAALIGCAHATSTPAAAPTATATVRSIVMPTVVNIFFEPPITSTPTAMPKEDCKVLELNIDEQKSRLSVKYKNRGREEESAWNLKTFPFRELGPRMPWRQDERRWRELVKDGSFTAGIDGREGVNIYLDEDFMGYVSPCK